MLPQSVQFIDWRMRQTFENRSLSDGNVPPNSMPRNNYEDDEDSEFDESNDPNRPPPLSTSSEPIIRTIIGDYTKHDNSVYKTNISSYNAERNTILNYDYSSRQGLCLFPSPVSGVAAKEGTSQQVVSIDQRHQTFVNPSISERNVPPNMPRNNNDDDDNEFDRPPPLFPSSESEGYLPKISGKGNLKIPTCLNISSFISDSMFIRDHWHMLDCGRACITTCEKKYVISFPGI